MIETARGARVSVLVLLAAAAGGWPAARAQEPAAHAKTFEVTASRFAFAPDVLEVSEGDEVTVTLRSADTAHGFEIKTLGVKMKVPKGGDPVTVTFVARRAGRHAITCSEYCGSGHRRMKATLVVGAAGGTQ